jgi:hypothetical protein
MPVNTTIKLRRDTTSNWTTGTKNLAEGEIGIDTTTGKLKFGGTNGTVWSSSIDVAVNQADRATSISGGAAGQMPYQTAANTTSFTAAASAANKVLVSGTSGTGSPAWVSPTLSTTYFATTTSSQLLGVVTDATGSAGNLVFSGSPDITTPTFISGGGVRIVQASGSYKTSVVAPVASGDLSLNLPSTAGTLALTTVTNSFLKADGTVQGSPNAYMTGTLKVGATGFSVTTAGNMTVAGDVTFSNFGSDSGSIAKLDTGGQLMAGSINLGANNVDVVSYLQPTNGGLGVALSNSVIGATDTAKARSVLRIFVQSTQPATGNPSGYVATLGDLWFW